MYHWLPLDGLTPALEISIYLSSALLLGNYLYGFYRFPRNKTVRITRRLGMLIALLGIVYPAFEAYQNQHAVENLLQDSKEVRHTLVAEQLLRHRQIHFFQVHHAEAYVRWLWKHDSTQAIEVLERNIKQADNVFDRERLLWVKYQLIPQS